MKLFFIGLFIFFFNYSFAQIDTVQIQLTVNNKRVSLSNLDKAIIVSDTNISIPILDISKKSFKIDRIPKENLSFIFLHNNFNLVFPSISNWFKNYRIEIVLKTRELQAEGYDPQSFDYLYYIIWHP